MSFLLRIIKYWKGWLYSMRTILSFLNQNFPFEVIFSESMLKFFSCTKSLLIVFTFCEAAANCCLKVAVSVTTVYPACCAKTVDEKSIGTKNNNLRIRFNVEQFI